MELEFGFNFNPTSVTKDDIISGSYSKSKQNGLNSSPVDANDESGENFEEFRDAFSETGSKHEVRFNYDFILYSIFYFKICKERGC